MTSKIIRNGEYDPDDYQEEHIIIKTDDAIQEENMIWINKNGKVKI